MGENGSEKVGLFGYGFGMTISLFSAIGIFSLPCGKFSLFAKHFPWAESYAFVSLYETPASDRKSRYFLHPTGVEPVTTGSEDQCSIQLS